MGSPFATFSTLLIFLRYDDICLVEDDQHDGIMVHLCHLFNLVRCPADDLGALARFAHLLYSRFVVVRVHVRVYHAL